MAQRTVLVSDISGKEGSDIETLTYVYKGVSYEIDLTEAEEQKLAEVLDPYLKVSRRVTTQARTAAPRGTVDPQARENSRAARAWAQGPGEKTVTEAGLKIPGDRGRVDGRIMELWEEAGRPKA